MLLDRILVRKKYAYASRTSCFYKYHFHILVLRTEFGLDTLYGNSNINFLGVLLTGEVE